MSLDKQFLALGRIIVLQNVRKYLSNNTAKHLRRLNL